VLVLTGLTVIAGRWAQGKPFEFKIVTGTVVVIVLLYIFNTFAPEVAEPLATLTLVATLLAYGPDIFRHLGVKETVKQTLSAR
jgi:hypothetical protein